MKEPFRTLEERIQAFRQASVYPVITPEFCAGRDPLDVFEAVAAGGAKLIQLRCKNMEDSAFYELACACRKTAAEREVLLILDDRIDIALAVHADGVHLGQTDLPLRAAKKISGELLIGVSTHNEEEIRTAHEDGADYLNIGPVFATQTKSVQYPAVGLENLAKWIPLVRIPFSVMGGIKAQHLPLLRDMGVLHPAMVTEITQAPDVRKRTEELMSVYSA